MGRNDEPERGNPKSTMLRPRPRIKCHQCSESFVALDYDAEDSSSSNGLVDYSDDEMEQTEVTCS